MDDEAVEPMTPEEFVRRMAWACNYGGCDYGDLESRHKNADALLCEALRSLGYGIGVDAFEKIAKWYG